MTINEWAEDFKSFVNELQMPRDDYKGIMLYIDDGLTLMKEHEGEYERGFNDAMMGKQDLMYEDVDGKWHKKDW